ncbi:MAG: Rrf2 family transcriptional regulator [Salaquimonas sp.]|jgi:Rrf2 family nitric oxide-sensitive transcriptional repressor|nr:Rrf2 family transcriptional regulator [Salaquimonas sp.]
MRLSLFTDYAFRLLIHVAARDPELVTITQVSEAYGIPRNHLTKIAHELGRAGYLETVRGRGGGMRLARPAGEISLGRLVRLGEGRSPLVECFDRATNQCVITPACSLKHMLTEACNAFYAVLDHRTLADVVKRPRELLNLLEN